MRRYIEVPVLVVTGCASCPMCAELVVSWGYERTQNTCQHPAAAARMSQRVCEEESPKPEKSPEWCPLRLSPLTAALAQPRKLKVPPGEWTPEKVRAFNEFKPQPRKKGAKT